MRPTIGISLGLLALMVSGPFLFPYHSMPIPSFWGEWWACALGLAAATVGLAGIRDRPLVLPQALVIPAVLILVLLLQFGFGRVVFPQVGLLYAVYLLWAAMLMVLGRRLADGIGLARLADVIASALVLGALIGAEIALAQWMGVSEGREWIFPKVGGAVYANLAQPNHHMHYSWLGIASAFYLRGRGLLSRQWLWALILLIAYASVFSGSRSVFVYPVVLLAMIAWLRLRAPHGQGAALLTDAAFLLPVVIALSFFGAWAAPRLTDLSVWLHVDPPSGPVVTVAGSRLYDMVSGPSARMGIARSAWTAFVDQPWLGQGAGNYTWASFVAASSHVGDELFRVAEHAHNFILQLLAEFGGPATGIVVLAFGIWFKRFLAGPWSLEQFWCGTILGIGAVHALLEYPLWYAYFLGPAALLLGATDSRSVMILPARRAVVYMILFSLLGASILTSLRKDYATIEAVSNIPLAADPDRERAWRISMNRLLSLHSESLLSPWALLAISSLAEPSRQQAQHRTVLCERGIRFAPARSLVIRCAMQLAIVGRLPEAETLARDVMRAYPEQSDTAKTIDELAIGARIYPEILPVWQATQRK